jgi:tetratricopeptide (TPR) repeat protein
LTSDRDRLRGRLLAFAGLSLLFSGLLAAVSSVVIALAAFGVLLLAMLAAVGISLLRRLPVGRGLRAVRRSLRAVLASAARAVRALKPRLHARGVGVEQRVQRLRGRGREAARRAPGRVNHLLVGLVRGYVIAVYWLRMRTAQAFHAGGTLAMRLSRLRPRPVRRSREARELNALGARLRREGAHEEAAEQHRVALAIVRDLGDERAEALTLNNLALALAQGGDEEEAVQLFEQALLVLRELGDEAHQGPVIANLGIVHRRQGHSEEAVHLLHEALDKLPPESSAYRQVEAELRRAS